MVCFDGRLDNAAVLANRFNQSPRDTDASLVLATYLRMGQEAAEQLDGDFALAIWDERVRRWYCARDRLGLRPLFYTASTRGFACSSSARSLALLPWNHQKIDLQGALVHLTRLDYHPHRTHFSNVSRLSPAHSLTTDEGSDKCRTTRYWELDPFRRTELSDSEVRVHFEHLFRRAVERRVQSSPFAVSLSGGLDSSSIYGVARTICGQVPLAISARFPATAVMNESAYAESAVGNRCRKLDWVYPEKLANSAHIEQAIAALEEPNMLEFHEIVWAVASHAASTDIDSVLTGHIGDAVISYGQGIHQDLAIRGEFGRLFRELLATGRPLEAIRRAISIAASAHQPLLVRQARSWYRASIGALARQESWLLTPAARKSIGLRDRLYNHPLYNSSQPLSSHQLHALQLTNPFADLAFVCMERVGFAHGITHEHPFMDRELVEFCVALPEHWKLQGSRNRRVLREAHVSKLPNAIRTRTKKTVFTPYLSWAIPRAFSLDNLRTIHRDYPELQEYLVSPLALWPGRSTLTRDQCEQKWKVHRRWRHASLLVWYDCMVRQSRLASSEACYEHKSIDNTRLEPIIGTA